MCHRREPELYFSFSKASDDIETSTRTLGFTYEIRRPHLVSCKLPTFFSPSKIEGLAPLSPQNSFYPGGERRPLSQTYTWCGKSNDVMHIA